MFLCRASIRKISMITTILIYLSLIAISWVLCRWFEKKLVKLSEVTQFTIYGSIVLASILLSFWAFDRLQFSNWGESIPTEIEISKNIDVGTEYGLFDGCGFAVFELSPNTLKKINTVGIDTLSTLNIGGYYSYDSWLKTPRITSNSESNEDFWQMGMSCGYPSMNTQMKNDIQEALNNPGSFYALANDVGLIVIPKLKLVVISVWHD